MDWGNSVSQVGGLEQVAAVSSKLESEIPAWQFSGWHRAAQGTHLDGGPDCRCLHTNKASKLLLQPVRSCQYNWVCQEIQVTSMCNLYLGRWTLQALLGVHRCSVTCRCPYLTLSWQASMMRSLNPSSGLGSFKCFVPVEDPPEAQLVPCRGLQQVQCDVSQPYTKFLGVSREIELSALAWVTGLGSSTLLRFLPLFQGGVESKM